MFAYSGVDITLFRVLGLQAVDRSPALRAPMELRLLAALLCRPNVVVPVEDLIAALWGEQKPPRARKALQVMCGGCGSR
ncbi:winged helix-turn-helix domain-containing protein [Allorhizocola rhizosphaerae]|uniref:winged helix-turn-helix domain-containing protein n=1 Tax=Allorhizocola rhizosphaerae TaxID=1872709 RepID=UPI0013C30814|nr:winged helix-turn-helix domain-containing protein [Allorhizocola rhizosphaerae]